MKYFLFTIFLSISIHPIRAQDASLFHMDENHLKSELEDLIELELFVRNNPDFTVLEMNNMHDFQHIQLSHLDTSDVIIKTGPPLGIPSFIWGLCLSIPGIVLVYSLTANTDELKKAMLGCIIGTGLYGGCYSLIYGLSSW
ncbi:MAG: hypothetical protein ISR55_07195 [Bacteroidetes bacterium]|nr:hypothetical protein [Bacteroidota bacterium]